MINTINGAVFLVVLSTPFVLAYLLWRHSRYD